MKILRIACMFGGFLSLVLSLSAQTFTTLRSFDGTDGSQVFPGLVQAANGDLYGATADGGANSNKGCVANCGTVFKITLAGKLTTLYSFCSESGCSDGAEPQATLVQDTNGNLYGTTFILGADSGGTVFKISPGGKLTTLYSFCSKSACGDGSNPGAALVQATNGDLYGTTLFGGSNACSCGTVFKIAPSGALTTLHSFDSTDGSGPEAALIQATDGNFYGTTSGGGVHASGTVFKITPAGKLTTLYSFCSQTNCPDGANPIAGLIQATDGNFYGTATQGGANGGGTVFKITPSGKLTTLHTFDGTDGFNPEATLVLATDENFYGTTCCGGADGDGTIFKITPSGKLTTLHTFDGTDGEFTAQALVQDSNGKFYGTAPDGGAAGDGTIFSLSVGLGPFVETQPTSGKVGSAVKILGTNLTGATSVTFNGTAALFKVVSASLITTNVPTGATTGTVEVKTPKGTLKSNVAFRVTK